MEYIKETKEKFIELYGNHEIVTVSRKYGNSAASYENKFIGTHNGLKWDFTPLVISLSGCKANASGLAARGFSKEILMTALQHLLNEGFNVPHHYILHVGDFSQQYYF